jgi:dihydropteroate synthase
VGERNWKIGHEIFDLSRRGWIMGVLNVTPDSFSDGGRFFSTELAVAHGKKMLAEGADVIDVGGESTRPGAGTIDAEEERRRVIPVIEQLAREGNTLISIDTSKAEVAESALNAGAKIINDVTGGRGDRAMWPLAAERGAGFIVMHMQGTPRTMQVAPHYDDVVAEVGEFFRQQYACAIKSGIDPMTLAFDPGIGFGKTPAHNLALLKNLERMRLGDQPLVVGVSHKSFLSKITEKFPHQALTRTASHPDSQDTSGLCPPLPQGEGRVRAFGNNGSDRLIPTVAFTSLVRGTGADIVRVHDVKENVEALRVADAVRGAA